MLVTDDQRQLLALCALRVRGRSADWSLLARCAMRGGLEAMARGEVDERSPAAGASVAVLREGLADEVAARARVDDELAAAERVGARLTTVLDEDYPANLRLVPDLPPFLFYRGELRPDDALSVAVVGTRQASEDGLTRARRMAEGLVERGVTVTSGLARGVDTAAHESTLERGGRTIAVLGTGVTRCYPPENAGLAERVAAGGALVSQFWPTRPPGRDTFPRRNRVTSGISQGTVVVEASRTSGAKMQARLASEHGKQVFLLRSLVETQEWARSMLAAGRAVQVGSVGDVVDRLDGAEQVGRQASHEHEQLLLGLS